MALTKEHMAALFHQVCSAKDVKSIAALLETNFLELIKMRLDKPYYVFEVRKQKGNRRLIETPRKDFKVILRKLNAYLQSAYFFCRTQAAYGFIQQPRNANRKRNILTNAKAHCGRKYLLNIDLKDFFHQVSRMRVISVFRSPPFAYNMELSDFLAELTTYQGRLPMGSPTSPALSNFAIRDLDISLEAFVKQNNITYSRYVDDLSFSSNTILTADHFYYIQNIITSLGFAINPDKIQWMGENDIKTVTGLILKNRPEVSEDYLNDLKENIKRFKHARELTAVTKAGSSNEWLDEFKDFLQGKLRFLQMIYGYHHPLVKKMNGMYYDAYNTKSFVESFSWNNFPYA